MSLYRCAACGSPNVVTDTQTGGIKYNYVKGAISTVALGVGGAAAGITNETQRVFKCPDCGITLTYAMPQDMKNLIDIGVMSADARNKLSYSGIPITWDFLLSKYKNIESGLGDQIAKKEADTKRLKALRGIEILKSKGTATREVFDASVDQMKLFEHRMGYDRGIFDNPHEDEFTIEKPASFIDYMTMCQAVIIFIENFFKYFDFPQDNDSKYRDFSLQFGFECYLPFYLHIKLCDEYNTNSVISLSNTEVGDYVLDDPFLSELFLLVFKYLRKSDYYHDRFESAFKEYDSEYIGENIKKSFYGRGMTLIRYPQWLDKNADVARPCFMVTEGALYYWDRTFKTSPLGKDSTMKARLIGNELISAIKDNYFSYYPERRSEYENFLKDRETELENRKTITSRIASDQEKEEQLKAQIKEETAKIAVLEKKIFGKKKAAEQIVIIKDTISKYESECKNLEDEIKKLSNEPKPLSNDDFHYELLKKFDYYIAWHRVDEIT